MSEKFWGCRSFYCWNFVPRKLRRREKNFVSGKVHDKMNSSAEKCLWTGSLWVRKVRDKNKLVTKWIRDGVNSSAEKCFASGTSSRRDKFSSWNFASRKLCRREKTLWLDKFFSWNILWVGKVCDGTNSSMEKKVYEWKLSMMKNFVTEEILQLRKVCEVKVCEWKYSREFALEKFIARNSFTK